MVDGIFPGLVRRRTPPSRKVPFQDNMAFCTVTRAPNTCESSSPDMALRRLGLVRYHTAPMSKASTSNIDMEINRRTRPTNIAWGERCTRPIAAVFHHLAGLARGKSAMKQHHVHLFRKTSGFAISGNSASVIALLPRFKPPARNR